MSQALRRQRLFEWLEALRTCGLRPPESSWGPPGRPIWPQEAPRAPRDGPRSCQERSKSCPETVSERSWRPPGADLSPRGFDEAILTSRELDVGPSGGQFSRSPTLHLEPSGEHFRLLSGLEPSMPKPPALAAARCYLAKNRLPKKSASPWEARTQGLPFP